MRKTLRDIAHKLSQYDHSWLLAGKTAAVLQGAMIQAHKITLYSDQVTAYRFGTIFDSYRTLKVKLRSGPSLAGHAGTFDFQGVEVSIVGDPAIICQDRPFHLPIAQLFMEANKYVIDDVEIPLLPASWLILLGLIGNDMELARSLKSTGIDREIVMKQSRDLGVAFLAKPLIDALYETK
ncbi:hypothetical protein JXA80_03075 [bacterium]|nr:hypothetical protein [candidate division CSSED10-310 bacterium]